MPRCEIPDLDYRLFDVLRRSVVVPAGSSIMIFESLAPHRPPGGFRWRGIPEPLIYSKILAIAPDLSGFVAGYRPPTSERRCFTRDYTLELYSDPHCYGNPALRCGTRTFHSRSCPLTPFDALSSPRVSNRSASFLAAQRPSLAWQ